MSKRPNSARPPRSAYHHGALRRALIDATESLLAERGVEGFSLREVARRSGVSAAAPAHHFGDADGLLRAVATLAFDGLTAALKAGDERGGADPVAQLREQGVGYVGFALRYPGRFALMFRQGLAPDEAVASSGQAAFQTLQNGVKRLYGLPTGAELNAAQQQAMVGIWSMVHGFAHLRLAGQLVGQPAEQVGETFAEAPACSAVQPTATDDASQPLLCDLLAPMLEQHLRSLPGIARHRQKTAKVKDR